MKQGLPKIIVLLGPTATGKSALSVFLAKKLNGEIVSADSRQVYRGMDIGSGKITKKEMGGITHYMLDVVNPKKVFSVAHYQKRAHEAVSLVLKKKKVPIIVGGTGFYIQAIVDNTLIPEVAPNISLRKKLEKKSAPELYVILKKLDPRRAKDIDKKNPVRLVRAIEIAKTLGKVPVVKKDFLYIPLLLGIDLPDEVIKKKIEKRLVSRFKQGMIQEVVRLKNSGISWKRLEGFGLEYREIAKYLEGKTTAKEMKEKLLSEIWHYAKRQRTWFKKDKKVAWFSPKDKKKILLRAEQFLKQ